MLRGIRKASESWLGRIVMGAVMTLLAVIFGIFWNINDVFRGYGRSNVATVGGTEISVDQFRRTYNERLQELQRQIGHVLTPEELKALGVARQLLDEMMAEAALDQLARQMWLGISDAEVVRRITSNRLFLAPTGQFDRARFQFMLQNMGYTEQRFVAEQRSMILRRQISDSVAGDLVIPGAWLTAINQFQNEERSIEYLALGPAQAGDIPQPTAEELDQYFATRKILFRAPEYRKVVTVAVLPAELAKSIEVSDEDVKRAYEQNISSYSTPERRHVEQIVFPNMDEANAASARLKSGLSFAALAAERKLKEGDIDLGMVSKSQIIDPAVADAAFTLKEGEVSAPVQGRFGAVIVTVLKIEAGDVKPLAVVAPFIRNDLALERAKAQAKETYNKVEEARAGSSASNTLEDAAQKLHLALVTYEFDRSGHDPSGKLVSGLPDAAAVIAAAFASDIGVDNDPLEADGGYIWYEVTGVTPARERSLDEVKSQVEERWHADQVAARLKAKAADLLEKLKSGGTFSALAAADGLKVETTSGIKRATPHPGLSIGMIDTVFHTPKDGYGSAPGDTPTAWLVYRVSDIKTPSLDPNSASAKTLEQLLLRQIFDDTLTQYVTWLENKLGTSINQAALTQAIGGASDNE